MITSLDAIADGAAYDIVVIGSGAAGMSAALFAAIGGAKVLLVERTGLLGGTSALSAATTWVPNTHHAAAIGADDSLEKTEHFLNQVVGNHSDAALRRAFLENTPPAIAALEAHSDVLFRPYSLHPDYVQEAEGATLRGRALEPLPFDGRQLGAAFALLRPPIPEFTILGGMMVDRTDIRHLLNIKTSWASLRHAMGLVGRYARDRLTHPRGTRLVLGNALIGRMLLSLLKRDVDIVLGTSTTELLHDGAQVNGLVLQCGNVRRRIVVRRGLILASGGFNMHKLAAPSCCIARRRFIRRVLLETPEKCRIWPWRSALASAPVISIMRSGRRCRSANVRMDRPPYFRILYSTAASRAPYRSTSQGAVSSMKQRPTICSPERCSRPTRRRRQFRLI